MNRSPIQQYMSALIRGFIEEANALRNLDQDALKGRLRELFVSRILSKFLTIQFGMGTGVIMNQSGEQSKQIDIIIYDRTILPPFIEEQKIGIYPAECVLAVIEVKSWLTKEVIRSYSNSATQFYGEIYNPDSSLYPDFSELKPLCALVGLYHEGIFKNESHEEILQWINKNATILFGVCLVNRFSWLHVTHPQGSLRMADEYNEETKAFVAVLLDNIRTLSQQRSRFLSSVTSHYDWLGIYLRDQRTIREIFEKKQKSKQKT